jgi:hypothetical protein
MHLSGFPAYPSISVAPQDIRSSVMRAVSVVCISEYPTSITTANSSRKSHTRLAPALFRCCRCQ